MGLTIHYNLRSKLRSVSQIRPLIEQLRSRAFDLPFHVVGPLITMHSDDSEAGGQEQAKPRGVDHRG